LRYGRAMAERAVDMLAHTILGALSEAAMAIARAAAEEGAEGRLARIRSFDRGRDAAFPMIGEGKTTRPRTI